MIERLGAFTVVSYGREMTGRVVALAVTGSVAAYKAVEVARLLVKRGHRFSR